MARPAFLSIPGVGYLPAGESVPAVQPDAEGWIVIPVRGPGRVKTTILANDSAATRGGHAAFVDELGGYVFAKELLPRAVTDAYPHADRLWRARVGATGLRSGSYTVSVAVNSQAPEDFQLEIPAKWDRDSGSSRTELRGART